MSLPPARRNLPPFLLINAKMANGGGPARQRSPPAALTALSPVLSLGFRRMLQAILARRRREGDARVTNGSRGAMHVVAARHYRAPKHTSCIIPPMLLCFPTRSPRRGAPPIIRPINAPISPVSLELVYPFQRCYESLCFFLAHFFFFFF